MFVVPRIARLGARDNSKCKGKGMGKVPSMTTEANVQKRKEKLLTKARNKRGSNLDPIFQSCRSRPQIGLGALQRFPDLFLSFPPSLCKPFFSLYHAAAYTLLCANKPLSGKSILLGSQLDSLKDWLQRASLIPQAIRSGWHYQLSREKSISTSNFPTREEGRERGASLDLKGWHRRRSPFVLPRPREVDKRP